MTKACVSPMSAARASESPIDTMQAADPPRESLPQTTMFGHASKARSDNSKTARDPVRTILVFSAVVAPLAIVPYVLVRRHLTGLHTQLAKLQTQNVKLAKELTQLKWDVDNGLEATRRHINTVVEHEGQKLSRTLAQAGRAAVEQHTLRRAWEGEMQRCMNVLLNENRERRTRLAADLKELGQSLADTAAFVQEVEMRQGWTPRPEDGRGIERTRRLARRLQETAASLEEDEASPAPQEAEGKRDEETQTH